MNGEQIKLYEIINNLILSGKEGQYWDFKEQWPDNKIDIMKDIICMANNLNNQEGYIIFGVKDPDPGSGSKAEVIGVENGQNRLKQADIIDQLSKMSFAGNRRPSVKLDTLEYHQKLLDIITVQSCDAGPIYLEKKYSPNPPKQSDSKTGSDDTTNKNKGKKGGKHELYPGTLYVRDQDRTTPWDATADPEITEKLWKKHFHMFRTPMEDFLDLLEDPSNWEYIDGEEGSPALFRCKLNPDYRMEICNSLPEESENCITVKELRNCIIPPISSEKVVERIKSVLQIHERHEFYAYTQPSPLMGFSKLRIEKNLQSLKEVDVVYLNEYRALLPLPNLSSFLLRPELDLWWIYYMEGSLQEKLLKLMNQTLIQECQTSVYRQLLPILLLFHSEAEKDGFEKWCKEHKEEVKERFEQQKEGRSLVNTLPYPDVAIQGVKVDIDSIYFSATLKSMLEDFRRQIKE